MDPTHTIRLRGPWECEPLARFVKSTSGACREAVDDLPAGGKTQVPGDWAKVLGADFVGRARYRRRFNCPTNLDPCEHVWLVFDRFDHEAAVVLNGQPLGKFAGPDGPQHLDITPVLLAHNELTVDVSLPAEAFDDASARGDRAGQAGGLVGEVRLEIGRDPAA